LEDGAVQAVVPTDIVDSAERIEDPELGQEYASGTNVKSGKRMRLSRDLLIGEALLDGARSTYI
jgi:hypothetical protein